MRLVFFNDYVLGVVRGQEVVGVQDSLEGLHYNTPQQLIEQVIVNFEELAPRFQEAIRKGKGLPMAQARLRPPVPRPQKLLCAVGNYLEHGQQSPQAQDFFLKSPSSVIGDRDTVELPSARASIFHHEAELAVVVGKTTTKVSRDQAMASVFGYVPFIDVSARGLNPEGRLSFFMMKSWDTFGPMGPALVTADEIPDPHNLQVRLWVNNALRQDYNTSDMAHPIPEIIEFLSSVVTLEPGDVIATGTNHQGLGALQDGDTMVMEIEGLGTITVYVRDPLKREWPRGVDGEIAARESGQW